MYRGLYDMQAHAHALEPVQHCRQAVMTIQILCWTKLELLRSGIVQKSKTEHGQMPTFEQQVNVDLCSRCVSDGVNVFCYAGLPDS